jgi:hypothetical protein
MRKLLLAAVFIASSCETSLGQTGTFPSPDTFLAACINTSHEGLCNATRENFTRDYKKARQGDYPAQRNVAFCLSTGCDGAVVTDATEGCAWRMVIQGTNVRKEPTERMSYSGECGSLANGNRREALDRAEAMFEAIYKKKLPTDKLLRD